jgi:hypothetical protein
MNAFFIDSPLQLLNAIEARRRVEGLAAPPVLILGGDESNLRMMEPLLGLETWFEVLYLNRGRRTSIWGDLRRIETVVRDLGPFQTICLGDYRFDLMRHFASVANSERLVLLDDGLGSLFADETGLKIRTAVGEKSPLSARLKATIKTILLRQKDQPNGSVLYFSAYDLPYGTRENTIKNDYSFLRSHFSKRSSEPFVYFVGSPLPEAGVMEHDLYLCYLKAVTRFFADDTIIYIGHRRETDARLKAIAVATGVKTQRLSTIIEWELAHSGRLPAVLAGFNSAALLHCHCIFGGALKVTSFSLRPEHQARNFRADSQFLYDYYRKRFEVVDPKLASAGQRVEFERNP